jgi:uncharacterized lipoprotein
MTMAKHQKVLLIIIVAVVAACGIAAHFLPQQLCIDQMARMLAAKDKDMPPDMFIRRQRDILDLPDAPIQELNEAWEKWLVQSSKDKDRAFDLGAFRKMRHCS